MTTPALMHDQYIEATQVLKLHSQVNAVAGSGRVDSKQC